MNRHLQTLMLVFVGSLLLASSTFAQEEIAAPEDFAFDSMAVQTNGRIKSFASHASTMTQFIVGSRTIDGMSPSELYFDLMLRPDEYHDVPLIFVKNKSVRGQIAETLRRVDPAAFIHVHAPNQRITPEQVEEAKQNFERDMAVLFDRGLIAEHYFTHGHLDDLLDDLSQDLIRTAKTVEAIDSALSVKQPQTLMNQLTIVPPPTGDEKTPWLPITVIVNPDAQFEVVGMSSEARARIVSLWDELTSAWLEGDRPTFNRASVELQDELAQLNPDLYPDTQRLTMESWYFSAPWWAGGRHMTGVWVYYALAAIPLLLSVVYRWKPARWMGLLMFVFAFGFHTAAILLRTYVADRWPNSNMFEAVTTAAWFGGVFALLIEMFVQRTNMRNIFALTAAVSSMLALMAAKFLPLQLNPNISNKMPVLHDVWLYIHTNVIIFSYCLIFMAALSAGLYLIYRGLNAFRAKHDFQREYARVGGAGSLIMTTPSGETYIAQEKTTFGQVLDGVTMVLMESSFILLWAGIAMGAIWADHSWGRPWGWDPKEVFALNTFIVFAVLVHLRLKVKDKGLWTAVLALIGAAVMLFNWVFINFFITGLHSYA